MKFFSAIFKKDLWTKPLVAWYLYDFANSFVFINATLYFSQWVVVDNHVSDFLLAAPFMVATAILVFLSPYIGSYGDRYGAHYRIFLWSSIGILLSAVLIFVSGRIGLSSSQSVILALIFYALYQFFYQLAFVPYGVFMKFLAPAGYYGKVSGIGFGVSEMGHIAGLVLTFPIVYGTLTIFGADRLAPLFLAAIAFFLFSLPSFFVLRSRSFGYHQPAVVSEAPSFFKSFWRNLRDARQYPGVLPLLISFYLFSDAIISLTFFSAIYLQSVFGADDFFKIKAAVLVILGFTAGAVCGGIASDKIGHRRVLLWSLAGNAAVIVAIALAQEVSMNLILFSLFGVVSGAAYASSRSYLATLIPETESGKFFGLYAFAERFASIIGPMVWGITIWLFASSFPSNYRIAAFAMAILVAIGIVPLLWRKKDKSGRGGASTRDVSRLRETYNRIAEDWHEDHKEDSWWHESVDRFAALLPSGGSVLDIGCGGGNVAKYLAKRGFRVLGIDFSGKMIEIARREVPDAEFQVLDMRSIDMLEGVFDGVLMKAALLHIPKNEVAAVFGRIATKLKKGGYCYLAVKERKTGDPEEKIEVESDYGYQYERLFSYFTLGEVEDVVDAVGMEIVWQAVLPMKNTRWIVIIAKYGRN